MIRFAALFTTALFAQSEIQPFLKTHCQSCHGEKMQMAQRRFDQLRLPVADQATHVLVEDMLNQLNAGKMPPPSTAQPDIASRKAVIDSLTAALQASTAKRNSTGGQTVLRRLNRREYLNTVGDLFHLDMLMFDPTGNFPRDQMAGYMDNIGDTLVTSGYLLEQYLAAAEQVVEKALPGNPRPAPQTWVFNDNFRQQQEFDYAHLAVHKQRYLSVYENSNSLRHEGAYAPIRAFAKGVPADGLYEIRVLAEALNRLNPYDVRLLGRDPEDPFRLGIVPGNDKAGPLHHPQPIEPLLAETVLKDGAPQWYTFRVWLDAGYTPRFTFPNGMIDSRRAFTQIIARYRQLLPEEVRNAEPGIYPARPIVLTHGKMPHIRIHEVNIQGPLNEPGPTPSELAIFGDKPFAPERIREILTNFAGRAYRRPARPEEVDRLMAVVERRVKDGKPPIEGLKTGLKAALASPAFIYLDERGKELSSSALAARLSYFLWSTTPDAALDLNKPNALLTQTRRLLNDPRSSAFINGFLDSWLNLRGLGDMPADRDAFLQFYALDLQAAMRRETRLFTRHLLDNNRTIVDFLNADYSFLNRNLAKHYGEPALPVDGGHKFRQVKLVNPNRGGLLGQGSVLTVTANGIETSAVTRGVWLLENILGDPPAPPPDNVPPIDPDVRGAKSMREILTKHRENPTCFSCHQKIDAPGFALENFDPIGAWRESYANSVPIDASGQLPGGKAFQNVAGLKEVLVERRDQFARMLTERLLTYACGRRMEASDRPRIDRIVSHLRAKGYGFRDLIELVVASETFRHK